MKSKAKLIYDKFSEQHLMPWQVREFMKFLLKHNAYQPWLNNVSCFEVYKNPRFFVKDEDIYCDKFLDSRPDWNFSASTFHSIIDHTLYWGYTFEDLPFWSTLDDLWRKHCKLLRIKKCLKNETE